MPNHHYVPRLYLKHFAINRDEPQVYSMSTDFTVHDEPSPISNICAKKNYNTPQQEQQQSGLEREHSKILDDFVKSPNPETFNRSHEFVESVSFLMGNNIYIRDAIAKVLSQMLLNTLESVSDGDISDISMNVGYRGQLKSSLAFADCVFEEFQSWKFVRHGPVNGEKVYITSDNPVSIFNHENVFAPWETRITLKNINIDGTESRPVSDGRMSSNIKINATFESVAFGQDVVMLFPITPSVCLLGFSNNTRYLRFMNHTPRDNNDILVFMNLITFSQCNKVVYSHSKELLEGTKINMPRFLEHCECYRLVPSFDAGIA